MAMHFNSPRDNKSLHTYPCSSSNRITQEYYNMLIGPINDGEILDKAICRIEDERFNTISYYLISSP